MFSFLVLTAKTCLQKIFGRLVNKILVLSTVTFWIKLALWRFVFFSLRQFECKFYACWQNKVSAVVRKTFLCQQDFFGRRYAFEIFKVFLSFSYFERNVLSLSVGKSWNNCENSTLRILNINFLAKTKTNWNFPKMFKFLVYSEKKFAKNFGRLVKSVPTLSTVAFWGKVIFLKIWFLSLWDFGLIFYALCQNKLSAVVQTNSRVSARNFLEKKVLFQFLETFHRSLTLGEIFQIFWWKKQGRVVKSACYMWETSFWGRNENSTKI